MDDAVYWYLMINVKDTSDTVFSTKLTAELTEAFPNGVVVNNLA
jgi:hypothetical protein